MNVALLGASDKPDRYAYKAQQMLMEHGYDVFPVRPAGGLVQGVEVYQSLAEIEEPIDTLTVYINSQRLEKAVDDVISLKPRRVILNPGTESDVAADAMRREGIEVEEACTLVLLSTGSF